MNTHTYLLIDFDSTMVAGETLDELARTTLAKRPDKDHILHKIEEITKQGMEGRISFSDSLSQRLALFQPTLVDIAVTTACMQRKVSQTFFEHRQFFADYADQIYVISGGFAEVTVPVATSLGIRKEHIFANTFLLDDKGRITGIDTDNPLCQSGGKCAVVQALDLTGDVVMLGDGFTDFEVARQGLAHMFIAYTEHVRREHVVEQTPYVVSTFCDVIKILKEFK
jgi:D-3-phosphoglycerate dehydrogenase